MPAKLRIVALLLPTALLGVGPANGAPVTNPWFPLTPGTTYVWPRAVRIRRVWWAVCMPQIH